MWSCLGLGLGLEVLRPVHRSTGCVTGRFVNSPHTIGNATIRLDCVWCLGHGFGRNAWSKIASCCCMRQIKLRTTNLSAFLGTMMFWKLEIGYVWSEVRNVVRDRNVLEMFSMFTKASQPRLSPVPGSFRVKVGAGLDLRPNLDSTKRSSSLPSEAIYVNSPPLWRPLLTCCNNRSSKLE